MALQDEDIQNALNISMTESELGRPLLSGSESESSQFDDSDADPSYDPNVNDRRTRAFDQHHFMSSEDEDDRGLRPNADSDTVASTSTHPPTIASTSSTHPQRRRARISAEQNQYYNLEWTQPRGEFCDFRYDIEAGMNPTLSDFLAESGPTDYFGIFLTEPIVVKMVHETNLYATQVLMSTDAQPQARMHNWVPTTVAEMKNFIAIIGWMGIVRLPRISDYWSTNDVFSIPFARNLMPRNRFELLLKFWHFADNNAFDPERDNNRLYKIDSIVEMFISNFQESYKPGNSVCIDESMIHSRNRIGFRQYIPGKKHKYGIKVYKLCAQGGYTWNLEIYCGKDLERMEEGAESAIESVVLRLARDLLGHGRTLFTDNFYTSIPLAYKLLQRQTHLVGTLRMNRLYVPPEIKNAALKKGEIIAQETNQGLNVLKWHDKKDVMMLTTCHKGNDLKMVNEKRRSVFKPVAKLDYDKGKCSVDKSDQMSSYSTSMRKTIKWYRKVIIELVWGTSLVNAHFLFLENNTGNRNMSITDFKIAVIRGLVSNSNPAPAASPRPRGRVSRASVGQVHHLIQHPEKKRGRCKRCYDTYGRNGAVVDGRMKKPSVVWNICDQCQTYMCKECFNVSH